MQLIWTFGTRRSVALSLLLQKGCPAFVYPTLPMDKSLMNASKRVWRPSGLLWRKLQMMKLMIRIEICKTLNNTVQLEAIWYNFFFFDTDAAFKQVRVFLPGKLFQSSPIFAPWCFGGFKLKISQRNFGLNYLNFFGKLHHFVFVSNSCTFL